MTKFLNKTLAALALGAGAMVPAHAVLVGTTEVGSLDTYLGACAAGSSSDALELACITTLSGSTATLVEKVDAVNFTLLSDGTLRAIDVSPDSPGFYLLKFGAPGQGAIDSFVFQNLANLNWLAWNMTSIPTQYTIQGLSHYVTTSGTTSTSTTGTPGSTGVPEPGTGALALLGLGLLGAGFGMRRKQSAPSA